MGSNRFALGVLFASGLLLTASPARTSPSFRVLYRDANDQVGFEAGFATSGEAASWVARRAASASYASAGIYVLGSDENRPIVSVPGESPASATLPVLSADGTIAEGRVRLDQDPQAPFSSYRFAGGVRSPVDAAGWLSSDGLRSASGGVLRDHRNGSVTSTSLGDLGVDASGQRFTTASGISGDGGIVVGTTSSPSGPQAFLWESGAIVGLGDLPGGAFESAARQISLDGSAVIGSAVGSAGREGFLWRRETGVMVGLGDLPGGAYGSRALDLAFDGRTIVGDAEAAAGREAVIWRDGVMQSLGPGSAIAVSADGSVVVGNRTGAEPFVWTVAGGRVGLTPSVHAAMRAAGLDPTFTQVLSVLDVSPDGRSVVGTYRNTDVVGGTAGVGLFFAVVPEPAPAMLLSLGLCALAATRRRPPSGRDAGR